MGIVISRFTRPLKSFNIENRARKVLDKSKPTPAPPYPTTAEQLKISQKANPKFMEDHYKKDQELHARLKQVFVSSHIQQTDSDDKTSERLLPHRRTADEDYDYGFWEPKEVSEGRCHLKNALQFMSNHLEDPKLHTAETISSEHKLDPKDVVNILEYYRVFQVIKNDERKTVIAPSTDFREEIESK